MKLPITIKYRLHKEKIMNSLETRVRKKKEGLTNPHGLFRNEEGAIDLASIMVGIIVIGLIGGVIAATVFAVIPWTQDNAAKQQLDSVVSAESAYFGLSADNPPALPAGSKANSFGNSAELAAAKLMSTGTSYCVTTPDDGKSYSAFSRSASGKIFSSTDKVSKPAIFAGTLPTDCQFIVPEWGSGTPTTPPVAGYVDPTPRLTIFTYRCDTTITGALPLVDTVIGTETWSDTPGAPKTYAGAAPAPRVFISGETYKVTFDGTYKQIQANRTTATGDLSKCLRSIDHWGAETGVTDVTQAFYQTPNLVDVPEHIPTTITSMSQMFRGATNLNDPDIGKWDVSNVGGMSFMFAGATKFNQPLNDWKTSALYDTRYMFQNAVAFNQPLNKWDVSKVLDMRYMFQGATAFNQNLSGWNTASIVNGYASGFASSSTFLLAYLPPKATF